MDNYGSGPDRPSSTVIPDDGFDIRLIGDHLGAALCLLVLEAPGDPASLRIDYANDAAGEAWRTPVEWVVGSRLLESFPALADTDLPRCFASLVAEQRTATVDGFHYPGDERVESGTFSFEAFPVGVARLAIVFQRVGDGAPSAWHLRQLAAIVDSSSDAIISKTLDGTITSWNGAAERMYGYTREEAVGRSIDLIVPDDRREELRRIFDALRRDEHVDELQTLRVRKGGERIDVRLNVSPVHDDAGNVVGASATGRDISGEERARRELHESQALFKTAFDDAGVAMWLMNSEGQFVRVNQAAADLLGYRRGELEAMGVDDLTPPGTGAAVDERLRSLIGGKARRVQVEKQYVCKDGSLIWAEVNASSVRDDDGAIRYVMGQVQDVTARHEAEEQLRRTRDLYRLVADNSLDLIALIDLGGRFLFASSAYAHLLGYEPAGLVGTSSLELLHPDDRAVGEEWFRVLPSAPTLMTLRVRGADGSYLPVESHAGVVRDDDGAAVAYLAVSRDITHTLRNAELEDQLRHAQKLEAVGRLAGGIAHDFNNLLLAIRGFAELALRHVEARADSSAELGEIVAAVEKAAGLTRQLLAFSRRQVMNPQIVDLREVVVDMATLLRRLIGTDVELDTVCPDRPVHVHADRTQLEQVIANLTVNARDAMPDGGHLTIEVARHGGQALLVVRDDGTGMDAATGAQIFEPFFSTKGSEGTGLGLSTVHGIVSQSGGRIEVDSTPGRGTTFTIALPLTAAERAPHASVAPAATPKGSETILLVEDDPGVRFVVAEMLAERGYVLVTAQSGEEAREIARAGHPRIDLLLTDLVMGGLGGRETATAVLAEHPQAKVLYMSGYTDDADVRVGESDSAVAFIQKPFAGDELARRVRTLLDTGY